MIGRLVARFLNLKIANKMLLGYLSLSAITILIAVFVLSGLERINKINNSIVNVDVTLINIAGRMDEALLSQELYGRRYAILKSPDMLELFLKKNDEFDGLIKEINSMPEQDESIERLARLHKEYKTLFVEGLKNLGRSSSLPEKYDKEIKQKQKDILEVIDKVSSKARLDQNEKTVMTARIGTMAFRTVIVLCGLGILLSVGTAVLITRNISGSVNKLKLATTQVSEGEFDNLPEVQNHDELGELSRSFSEMAKRLKRLEEMYLDASPLTRLPGGVAIENVLKKRLSASSPMAFCLFDLDNFKAFNDKYGYARGSEVILEMAHIIEESAKKHGTDQDFIGHIGGDDFVVITIPVKFVEICNAVIESFDRTIPNFYDREDRERGYIAGKTRQGLEMNFPIMTISIAVVTNLKRQFQDYLEVGEVAAELKEYAKSIKGSVYVVDQRRKR